MPFVHIELVEGRTEEQLTKMVEEVTKAVSSTVGAPKENIHVIINEMQKGNMHKAASGNNKLYYTCISNQ